MEGRDFVQLAREQSQARPSLEEEAKQNFQRNHPLLTSTMSLLYLIAAVALTIFLLRVIF